jgi:hypothetical protein
MAVLPLNTFKTIARPIPTVDTAPLGVEIYSCPAGVTAIVLLAQISNVGTQTGKASFSHMRLNNETFLVKNAAIPINDALSVLTGRLVAQESDRIRVTAASGSNLQIVLSIVESANS